MLSKYKGSWYIQHSRDIAKVVGERYVSHLAHRTLVLERHTRPELVVVFNEKLQYKLAERIREDEYLILTSVKEQYHGSQGKSRRSVRKPGRVPSDEEPA